MGGAAAAGVVTERLLLDEHYSEAIAASLRTAGYDVLAVVADDELRAASDAALFEWAAAGGRRIVTENIKDFRPLLVDAITRGVPMASLLLVSPRRFPRGGRNRETVIVAALKAWLSASETETRLIEEWLT